MKAVAVVLSVVAVAALVAAVRDMAMDGGSARRGWVLRVVAVLAFALAVVIGASAR